MKIINTILVIAFLAAAFEVAYSVNTMPKPKPVERPATVQPPDKPIQFEEAHQRYVEHLVHTKYRDRIPVEIERLERHAAIINEQLAVQRKLLEEARRP